MTDLIHQAVAARAAADPGRTALVHADETVDYATLDAAADRFAAAFAAAGIGSGSLVPVVLPRTPRLVAVQLALLKCGAAYSVLDPLWPRDRLAGLVARLSAPFAVADSTRYPFAVRLVAETTLKEAARDAPAFRAPEVTGASPAMVFFTSGTTGRPKGVVSPHRATMRLFQGPARPDLVMPQVAPASWDMYALEVWGTLTAGGMCVIPDDRHFPPETLREFVARHGVNAAHLACSLFNLFVDVDLDAFTGLREVMISGERVSAAHARRFVTRYPDVPLVNCYGPVESCMFVTSHRIAAADTDRPDGVPLGTAVPRTGVLVLSGERECAPGEEGEICLAGDGLAVEYLGDPELTADRFRTVRVGGEPVRVYRTGDLGYLDRDGLLRFRGRRDTQVKIRGYRVELGEVEGAARALPGVLDCAAVPVREPGGGYESLVLLYTAQGGRSGGDPLEVRAALARRLPDYLVPARARLVGGLPLTENGKLDRLALADAHALR
ncbi:AMP-binding protein [Actinomadura oligospora]|uniref:AMP-binding protein n=1 Tax=Actinomadura oligospora TaxID=111804 RepID=UPI0004BBE91D|nr:AMP-binding protein [Actinomadura oligospora]